MRSLSWLGFKSARRRAARSTASAAGLMLGVALLFGVLVANASVTRAMSHPQRRPEGNFVVQRVDRKPLAGFQLTAVEHLPNATVVRLDHGVAQLNVRTTDPQGWIGDALRRLGPGIGVGPMNAASVGGVSTNTFASFLTQIEAAFAAFSAMALFVAAFLVYLTVSASVVERVRLFGTLRSMGATARQIRRMVLAEALATGGAATAVGLVLGLAVAALTIGLLARAVGIPRPPMVVAAGSLVTAVTAGIVTSVAAALLPARQAARLDPVEAIAGTGRADQRTTRWWTVGVAAIVAGSADLRLAGSTGVGRAAGPLILLGSVLLVPPLLTPLARTVGRVLVRLDPKAAPIPVLHVVKERSRSANTLGLVMVVLAMTYALAATTAAYHYGIGVVYERQFGTGLVAGRSTPFTAADVAALRGVPGVTGVTPVAYGRTAVAGLTDTVMVIDPASYFAAGFSFAWRDGDDASARRELEVGGAVLLPVDDVAKTRAHRGSRVTLSTPSGPRSFFVAGTVVRVGYNEFMGPVVGVKDAALFGDGTVPFIVRVMAPPGAIPRVRAATGAYVRSAAQLRRQFTQIVDRYIALFDGIALIALIVGTLGVANTIGISVLYRTKEIGLLRSIGVRRAQVRRMVLIESTTLCLAALVMSVPVGWLLAGLIRRSIADQSGLRDLGGQPIGWLVPMAMVAILAGGVAALAPGIRASRLDPVEALRAE